MPFLPPPSHSGATRSSILQSIISVWSDRATSLRRTAPARIISASNEPSSCACTGIWRLPRESNFQVLVTENLIFTGMERFIRDVRTMRLFGPLEQRDTTRRSIPMREMQTQSASNCAANVTVTARARMIRSGVLLRQRRKRVYGW